MNNLALTRGYQGDHIGVRQLQERAIEKRKQMLGDGHPDTVSSMDNLAVTLSNQGDFDGARRLQENALAMTTHVLGDKHPSTLTSMNNLAIACSRPGIADTVATAKLLSRLETQPDIAQSGG
jgi:hypothetical protein